MSWQRSHVIETTATLLWHWHVRTTFIVYLQHQLPWSRYLWLPLKNKSINEFNGKKHFVWWRHFWEEEETKKRSFCFTSGLCERDKKTQFRMRACVRVCVWRSNSGGRWLTGAQASCWRGVATWEWGRGGIWWWVCSGLSETIQRSADEGAVRILLTGQQCNSEMNPNPTTASPWERWNFKSWLNPTYPPYWPIY